MSRLQGFRPRRNALSEVAKSPSRAQYSIATIDTYFVATLLGNGGQNLAFDFLVNCFAMRAGKDDELWVYQDQDMFRCDQEELREGVNAALTFRKNSRRVDTVRAIRSRQSR